MRARSTVLSEHGRSYAVVDDSSRIQSIVRASRAIIVAVDPQRDEDDHGNVEKLRSELAIDRFPILVALDVTETMMRERGRIVGYFEAEPYADRLQQLLPETLGAGEAGPTDSMQGPSSGLQPPREATRFTHVR